MWEASQLDFKNKDQGTSSIFFNKNFTILLFCKLRHVKFQYLRNHIHCNI